MGKVLVLYDSASGNTEKMAALVAEGAAIIPDAEVRLRKIDEVVPAAWNAPGAMPSLAVSPAYLVPKPLQHPKHLFHMIFRAEQRRQGASVAQPTQFPRRSAVSLFEGGRQCWRAAPRSRRCCASRQDPTVHTPRPARHRSSPLYRRRRGRPAFRAAPTGGPRAGPGPSATRPACTKPCP